MKYTDLAGLGQTDVSSSTWDQMLTDPYSLFTSESTSQSADVLSSSDVAVPVSTTPTLTQDLSVLGQLVQFGGKVYQYVQTTQNGQTVAQPVVVQAAPSGGMFGLSPQMLLIGGGLLAAVLLLS